MAYDLTLTSPVYVAYSGFGKAIGSGYGLASTPIQSLPFTIEARVLRRTGGSGNQVAAGQYKAAWIGINGSNEACVAFGTGNTFLLSGVILAQDVQHHLKATVSATEVNLYVDGVLKATAAATAFDLATYKFGVRCFDASGGAGTPSSVFSGHVDEVTVWSGIVPPPAAGIPAAPYTGAEAGLLALYHLDDNGLNSAAAAPPADTVKPLQQSAAVANGAPSIVAITMSEAMDGAFVPAASAFTVGGHAVSSVAISGTVINLTCSTAFVNGEAARTVAYAQPGTNNARDVAGNLLDSFSGLAITNNVSPAGDTTAPAFSSAQVTNSQPSVILVTMNETLAASVPPNSAFTPSGGRTVSSVSISGTVASVTVNTAYVNGDVITIAYTKPGANPRLQDATGNATETFSAQAVTNNVAAAAPTSAYDKTKILFSPYNWNVQSTFAKTVNGGAYFKTLFGGATCTLTFDMANAAAPYTKLAYRVDGTGPWIAVDLAASIAITMPTETAGYASHLLEVIVKATSLNLSRWSASAAVMVSLTGITLAAGKTLSLPTALPLRALVYGDSITEGYRSLNGTGDATVNSDASQSYAFEACKRLGAEAGIVAFSSQGWDDAGSGSVPIFSSTYASLYSGVARSFTPAPDFILINHGTNDTGDVTATATTVLNALIAATPSSTKIIVLRPFDGSSDADLIEAIAATTTPSRISYINTTGWFTTANAADGLHPFGFEHLYHIAPLTSAAILPLISSTATPPATTARNVTLQLGDGSGALANLTGLKVAFYDEASPDLQTDARYQSATETTDASGNLAFTVNTTLPSGGTGHITVLSAAGSHYNGPVAVA